MASRTRLRRDKPAAASKAKTTAVKKGRTQKTGTTGDKSAPNCNTLRKLARLGLCTLDDECTKSVMETLVELHPEMKQEWEEGRKRAPSKATSKRGPYKPRELKPPDLVTNMRTAPAKTLLRILYGDEYMPIINQKVPSRNAADSIMAQILTKHWGHQQSLPVPKIADLFGQKGHQKTTPKSLFEKRNGPRPWPPRQHELPGCHVDKVNESQDNQDQKATGRCCSIHLMPKIEVLGMEEEEVKVKAEPRMIPCIQKQPDDDDYDQEDEKMPLPQDNADRCDQHVKEETKREDSDCCPAPGPAAEGICDSSHIYNGLTGAALLWQEQRIIRSYWQSPYIDAKMDYEPVPDTQKPLLNACGGRRVKDEPMDEGDFINHHNFVEGDDQWLIQLDDLCNGEYMKDVTFEFDFEDFSDCSGGLVEGRGEAQTILDILVTSSQSELPPSPEGFSWGTSQP